MQVRTKAVCEERGLTNPLCASKMVRAEKRRPSARDFDGQSLHVANQGGESRYCQAAHNLTRDIHFQCGHNQRAHRPKGINTFPRIPPAVPPSANLWIGWADVSCDWESLGECLP